MIPGGIIPAATPNIAYRLDENERAVPETYLLAQNYPNPFNPSTMIRFGLPRAAHVNLDIFNIAGQTIATLCSQYLEVGEHTFLWNGLNSAGEPAASGIYFYRLKTSEFTESRKMILLK
jgi:hypothetical protein